MPIACNHDICIVLLQSWRRRLIPLPLECAGVSAGGVRSDYIWRYAQSAGDALITLLGDTELEEVDMAAPACEPYVTRAAHLGDEPQ